MSNLRGVAYRRQLVRGRSGREPSAGGWQDGRGRATRPAAHPRTPAGGAIAPHRRQERTDSLSLHNRTTSLCDTTTTPDQSGVSQLIVLIAVV